MPKKAVSTRRFRLALALSAFAAIEFVGVCLRCMLSVSASLALQFAAFLHDDDHAPPTYHPLPLSHAPVQPLAQLLALALAFILLSLWKFFT